MIRFPKTLLMLLFLLQAVTGCKFFEVQSDNRNANPAAAGDGRTKATQGAYGQSAVNLPHSDWSAPAF